MVEENFNLGFFSPPDGEENFNLEFSSAELRIEVHLSTICILELGIFGTNYLEKNFSLRGVLNQKYT